MIGFLSFSALVVSTRVIWVVSSWAALAMAIGMPGRVPFGGPVMHDLTKWGRPRRTAEYELSSLTRLAFVRQQFHYAIEAILVISVIPRSSNSSVPGAERQVESSCSRCVA